MKIFGEVTDEQWEKMKKFIKSDKYTKDDFFAFETLATGDKIIPDRYKRFTKEYLELMAEDAKKGVSLMLNHNEGQSGVQAVPIGKVFDSRMEAGTQNGENNSLYISQYILKDDSKIDGYSKNDIIKLIESGIIEDTSVGAVIPYSTTMCNICHKRYFSGECSHWAGNKYVVNEETGEKRTCVIEVNPPEPSELHAGNNVLIENSLVFDGAYPNAMIQCAKDGGTIETKNGKLEIIGNEEKNIKTDLIGYGSKYGLELMYKPFKKKGGKEMDEDKKEVSEELSNDEVVEKVENNVETNEIVEEDKVEETNTEVVEQEVETDEAFSITKEELKNNFGEFEVTKDMILTLAKEGKEYREKVIEETLKSGVRSMGNSFNKESFRKSFEVMSTSDILNAKESFEQDVKEKFGTSRVSKPQEVNNDIDNFEFKKSLDVKNLKTSNY